LKFDESIGSNAFAYYTTVVKSNFTKTLNSEKNVQKIRDKLLIEAGEMPSFSAQLENEEEYRALDGTQTIPSIKKGRKWPRRKSATPAPVVDTERSSPTPG
jgi:hypothetical protein